MFERLVYYIVFKWYQLNFEVIIYNFSMHQTLTGHEKSVVQGIDYKFATAIKNLQCINNMSTLAYIIVRDHKY